MDETWSRAEKVYEHIKSKLAGQEGKIVAIEAGSGDYFVGDDVLDAYEKARKKHPAREFHFMRVGFKTVYVIGTVPS